MTNAVLLVVSARVSSAQPAAQAVRRAMRLMPLVGGEGAVLLLCALGNAPAETMPGDAELLRLLQSGVASATARGAGRLFMLAISRVWDDAARAFVSPLRPAMLASRLLLGEAPGVSFAAATVAPASLRGAYERLLVVDAALAPMPGAPAQLAQAARLSPDGLARGAVLPLPVWPETLLARLERIGFALSPAREAVAHALAHEGQALTDGGPVLLERRAFAAAATGMLPERCPLVEGCFFVRREGLSAESLLEQERRAQAQAFSSCSSLRDWAAPRAFCALLPFLRLLVLLLCAALGTPLLALIAAVVPEGYALAHPRLLPGALVRLSLLPADAMGAADALLRRLLARSRVFRVELPATAFSPRACTAFGAALLALSIASARAVVPLTVVSILWLAAPLIASALSSPARERIPLSAAEQEEMLSLARTAFLRLPSSPGAQQEPAPLWMLTACAGCMLGLLEPDEAARRAQALLPLAGGALSAAQQAALLVCAQYLRERMAECDAALRPLPAALENAVRACPPPHEDSPLATLLRAARSPRSPDHSAFHPESAAPEDALFLPMPPDSCPEGGALEPLARPHTFLAQQAERKQGGEADFLLRFLALTCAALGSPFAALLSRSPLAEPAMPLLALAGRPPRGRLSSR